MDTLLKKAKKPIIGITLGDPNGIGPEIIIKGFKKINKICYPIVIGNKEIIKDALKFSQTKIPLKIITEIEKTPLNNKFINIINIDNISLKEIKPGKIDEITGKASLEYVKKAIEIALAKKIEGIVTAPVSKEAIIKAGYHFTGHTEFLAQITHTKNFAMMMVSPYLKVVLVSTHLPFRKVSFFLTPTKIYQKILLAHFTLKKYFGKIKPKIAVCALNPHMGEGGLLGDEEKNKIIPAIEEAKKRKIEVFGPFPSDSLFYQAKQGKFDVIISMYHDQGLIPVKLDAFEKTVNLTLGLPIIRTSVDHGVGFDIAGKGIADPTSLIEAIKLVVYISQINQHGKN